MIFFPLCSWGSCTMRRSVWSPWAAAMHICLQGQRKIKGGQTPVSTSQQNQYSGWNHFRQVRWNGQKTELGTALRQTGGELGPARGLLSEIKTLCLGFLDAQWKRDVGGDFYLLKTGVEIQLPAAIVAAGLITYTFCVLSLTDSVFCLHCYRN